MNQMRAMEEAGMMTAVGGVTEPETKTCRHCGKSDLHWVDIGAVPSSSIWRLAEKDGTIHTCAQHPASSPTNTSEAFSERQEKAIRRIAKIYSVWEELKLSSDSPESFNAMRAIGRALIDMHP